MADGGADDVVSTHSRLKAAGLLGYHQKQVGIVSTHSRLKAAEGQSKKCKFLILFQHTAA